MPMDIIVLYPENGQNQTTTVEDVVSFEIEHGNQNRLIADQTDGRSFEDSAIGLTVVAGTDTDDSLFE